MAVTIGIDVGGTKIAAGVVDGNGALVARRRIATEADDPRAVVAGITKVAQELLAAAPAVGAIGVGAAALVDADNGIVLSAPNISWKNVALRAMLEERVGVPVVVDNDANVAAWGEATHGAGAGAGDQVMVTVGTGIGGGIVIGGRLYRGARGVGAEIGHMVIQAEGGALCACGNVGCLEAMASGNSIGRRALERKGSPEAGRLVALGGDGEVTGQIVGQAAAEGDPLALEILAETGRWLGVGLANLVNIFDPALIVVGGGATAGTGDLLLEPARARMAELIIGRSWRTPPPVVAAALGYDAGIVGAAALARATIRR